MNMPKGTFRNGQVQWDHAPDWPEGFRFQAVPLTEEEQIGLTEEEWDDSPEGIAAWLHWYDSLEPIIMTPEEEADLAAWRQKVKEYAISKMDQRIEELFP
jgi:hypothetical protein